MFIDDIERFDELKDFYLGKDLNNKLVVEKVRYKGFMVIMKIKGIDSIEKVEKLKNKFMYVVREDSREFEEGEFFIVDMIGMEVLIVDGKYVGILEDVF